MSPFKAQRKQAKTIGHIATLHRKRNFLPRARCGRAWITDRKVAELLSRCLPRRIRQPFVDHLLWRRQRFTPPENTAQSNSMIHRFHLCIIHDAIQYALGNHSSTRDSLSRESHMAFVRSVDTRKLCCEGDKWQLLPFLLDATLNSGRNRAKKGANETTDWYMTPQLPKTVAIKGRSCSSKQKPDVYFRILVVVLPAASVFYCPFLCHEGSGRLMQGPISWLRLHQRDGDASKNSFIQTIHSAWQVTALFHSNGIPCATPVLKAGYHLHDRALLHR